MEQIESKDKKAGFVFYSSVTSSLVLTVFFLLGAFLTNIYSYKASYTRVDIIAGSVFVFVLTMIISLSLLPKIMEWRENREKVERSRS